MVMERFSDGGLFYSASNADSEGSEGAYFIFSQEEVEEALASSGHKELLNEAMEYDGFMNFDTHLHMNFYGTQRPQGFDALRKNLQKVRQKRHYPFVDQKYITAWNAMMIEVLYTAGRMDTKYIKIADEKLALLLQTMWHHSLLHHQSIGAKPATQEALLEDYAFMIAALTAAYETHYDEKYLALATRLMDQAIFRFYRQGVWLQADGALKIEVTLKDRYYTSSFGKIMQGLLKLAVLNGNLAYQKLAECSLAHKNTEIYNKLARVPSSTRATLMLQKGIIVIKHKKEILLENRALLSSIEYPYLLTESLSDAQAFLACKVDRCFAYDDNLSTLIEHLQRRD